MSTVASTTVKTYRFNGEPSGWRIAKRHILIELRRNKCPNGVKRSAEAHEWAAAYDVIFAVCQAATKLQPILLRSGHEDNGYLVWAALLKTYEGRTDRTKKAKSANFLFYPACGELTIDAWETEIRHHQDLINAIPDIATEQTWNDEKILDRILNPETDGRQILPISWSADFIHTLVGR